MSGNVLEIRYKSSPATRMPESHDCQPAEIHKDPDQPQNKPRPEKFSPPSCGCAEREDNLRRGYSATIRNLAPGICRNSSIPESAAAASGTLLSK